MTILKVPMSNEAQKGQQRPPRLKLPYMKRKPNAAAWTYDHRAGLCITIIVYLLLAIAFMGQKIVVHGRTPNNAFLVDMQTLEELIKEQQRLEQEVKMRQQSEV